MDLLAEYTDNYLEAIFYFCLKKTGNAHDAQDLSQEISECILEQIERGAQPLSISAWVWRIARNRYSRWVKEKQLRQKYECDNEIGALSCTVKEPSNAEERAKLAVLRRELAFIRSEYRTLLVAYYIDDRKISDIARSLNQNEGTVRTRLFRAREKLKEGMKMARTFGKHSYHPEDVNFSWSGSGMDRVTDTVKDLIAKNILLEASNNPSTAEELSIELGVALPYIDEKIEKLTETTLLRKLDNGKYITNFFIADRDCILAMRAAKQINRAERSALTAQIARNCIPAIRTLGVYPKEKSDEQLLPITMLLLIEELNRTVGGNIGCPPERENGARWDIVGHEIVEAEERPGRLGNFYFKNSDHGGTVYSFGSFYDPLLIRAIKSATVSEDDQIIAQAINDGIVSVSDRVLNIAIPVFDKQSLEKTCEIFRSHTEYKTLLKMYESTHEAIKNVFKSYSHEILHSQSDYCAGMEMCALRSYTLHDAEEAGYISNDRKPVPDTMYLILD